MMKVYRFQDPFAGFPQRSGKLVLQIAQRRLLFLGSIFAVGFLLLAVRLFLLGTAVTPDSNVLVEEKKGFCVSRANIVDRNGEILATSLITYSLYADTHLILDPQEAAEKLHEVLPQVSVKTLLQKLKSGKSFIWIKRNLTPYQYDAINRLGILGLSFQKEEKRLYPYGPLLSHVIGYTNIDHQGITGIEKRFDQSLHHQLDPLRLTLDIRLQHIVHEELAKSIEEFSALGGCGILMDVDTGQVLSLVSLPDFDPNFPGKSDPKNLFNMATLAELEMGSIFKIFTMAIGLEEGIIDFNSRPYDTVQPLKVGRFKIKDHSPKNYRLTGAEIFLYSSNIGSAQIALDIGPKRQKEFFQRLGFLEPCSIELPEVGKPLFPRHWSNVNAMTIGYGYGLAVSPLQLCTGISSLVNGGYILKPTLDFTKKIDPLSSRERSISQKSSKKIRQLMDLVVQEGSGRKAANDYYSVGVKTGSANKLAGGKYQKTKVTLATTVAAFPVRKKPRYVLLVMLDEPKVTSDTHGFTTAGWNTAPLAGRIIKRAGPLLGLPPEPSLVSKDFSPLGNAAAYED